MWPLQSSEYVSVTFLNVKDEYKRGKCLIAEIRGTAFRKFWLNIECRLCYLRFWTLPAELSDNLSLTVLGPVGWTVLDCRRCSLHYLMLLSSLWCISGQRLNESFRSVCSSKESFMKYTLLSDYAHIKIYQTGSSFIGSFSRTTLGFMSIHVFFNVYACTLWHILVSQNELCLVTQSILSSNQMALQIMILIGSSLNLLLNACVCVSVSVASLIEREDGSMEKEFEELRRSRPKPPVGGDFTLSDCFYFSRKGIESIVDDEVCYSLLC